MSKFQVFFAKVMPCLLILPCFAAMGYYVGWLVGASKTPVVQTALPLLIGLLGAVTYALLERKSGMSKLFEHVKKLQESNILTIDAGSSVKAALVEHSDTSYWLPAFWAICITLFAGSSYLGTQHGLSLRSVPDFPMVSEFFAETSDGRDQPSPEEFQVLSDIRLALISKNITRKEVQNYFERGIVPMFVPSKEVLTKYLPKSVRRVEPMQHRPSSEKETRVTPLAAIIVALVAADDPSLDELRKIPEVIGAWREDRLTRLYALANRLKAGPSLPPPPVPGQMLPAPPPSATP
jgi:hypothetical protein